ncbi:hypothetical protein L1987_24903 [Smallanthus sonchifolius]|uniref:Uncharacterized protein n=1 Tax=Smallanthus sonchifolius TaxID=185202 RepID=A0ACB9INI3_9ASTR|nr:hypothetical protein L1987_24903 [Smallanthus sonchifolius]
MDTWILMGGKCKKLKGRSMGRKALLKYGQRLRKWVLPWQLERRPMVSQWSFYRNGEDDGSNMFTFLMFVD